MTYAVYILTAIMTDTVYDYDRYGVILTLFIEHHELNLVNYKANYDRYSVRLAQLLICHVFLFLGRF